MAYDGVPSNDFCYIALYNYMYTVIYMFLPIATSTDLCGLCRSEMTYTVVSGARHARLNAP